MRKIENLPSTITIIFLKERERAARPVMHPQPNNQRQVLTNGAINSFDSKTILDTAMFLKDMQTVHHWDNGVAI